MKKLLSLAHRHLLPLYMKGLFACKVTRVPLLPRIVNVEITTRCNLRCKMCLQSAVSLKAMDMPKELFETILRKIPGLSLINIIGTGEPLLHPHFFDLLDMARDRNIYLAFTTNGVLLKEDIRRRLSGYPNLTSLSCSIDSADPDLFYDQRGVALEGIVENLLALRREMPSLTMTLQTIINRRNIEGLCGTVDLAARLNIPTLSFLHLEPYTKEEAENHAMKILDMSRMQDDAVKRGLEQGVRVITRAPDPELRLCTEPFWRPTITLSGDVLPCCFMNRGNLESTEEWFDGVMAQVPVKNYVLGTIEDQDFRALWNGPGFRGVRKALVTTNSLRFPTAEALNAARSRAQFDRNFTYCTLCLFRWGCAC